MEPSLRQAPGWAVKMWPAGNRRDSLTRQLHGGGVELLLMGVLRQCFMERLVQQVWAEA